MGDINMNTDKIENFIFDGDGGHLTDMSGGFKIRSLQGAVIGSVLMITSLFLTSVVVSYAILFILTFPAWYAARQLQAKSENIDLWAITLSIWFGGFVVSSIWVMYTTIQLYF